MVKEGEMEKGEKANKRYVDEQVLVWRGGGGSHWSFLKYPVVHARVVLPEDGEFRYLLTHIPHELGVDPELSTSAD